MRGHLESWENGGMYTGKGTEKDFPLTRHHSAYTGTDREKQEVEIPLTEGAELPQVKFHYGTVEFLSAMQEDVIWEDEDSERTEEATKVTVRYKTVPAKGIRKMYAANLRYLKEDDFGVERDLEQTNEFLIQERSVYLPREKREKLTFSLENPSYWVGGSYDVVIEKPRSKK